MMNHFEANDEAVRHRQKAGPKNGHLSLLIWSGLLILAFWIRNFIAYAYRLLPNRHHAFHFVDKKLAGGERHPSMRRDHFDPQRWFVYLDHAEAVHESHRINRPVFFHLLEDEFKLPLNHPLKPFVFDGADGLVCLKIA